MQWYNGLMSIWLQRSQDSSTEQICQEVEFQTLLKRGPLRTGYCDTRTIYIMYHVSVVNNAC